MFSFDYSDFPQQQTFLPNFHSPPYTSFSHERSPFQFHHQTLNLPHQMGFFLPQTLHQDPSALALPNNDGDASLMIPNSNSVYEFTCNQGSLRLLSPVKKDRHSKILTAHGVRDRRVRLSMAIAREFFDLQDMLGFDKASQTIGWLLAKSKGAIQELALAKQGSGPDLSRSNSSNSSSRSHHEDAFANSSTTDMTVMRMETRKRSVSSTPTRRRSRKSASASKEENEKVSVENQANFIAARENRAKARARARERTREKLSTVAKSIEFDDLGLKTSGRTSCSSQFLTDSKDQNISRSLHDQNVIRSRHSPPLISCPGYLQSLLSAPTGDQDGSVRVNHLPNLITASNNSEWSMCSSFSGWNIFSFPSEMHMTSKPWETWDNQVEHQYNQIHGEL